MNKIILKDGWGTFEEKEDAWFFGEKEIKSQVLIDVLDDIFNTCQENGVVAYWDIEAEDKDSKVIRTFLNGKLEELEETYSGIIEHLQEIGRVHIMTINNVSQAITDLEKLGYNTEVSPCTDYIVLK
jgi:precorrin-6B methylase 2